MKRFERILFYLRSQKRKIVLYVVFNLLSILFSLVSLAMLAPFMQLLFGKEKLVETKPEWTYSANALLSYLKYILSQLIRDYGVNTALAAIALIIVLAIFLKNGFTYLSYWVLAPMRNYIMSKLRSDLYSKILALPIGYFTEQKKGDIISRMSNDVNEIEWSVIGTLEGLIRDPLTILIILTWLIIISPVLSLFLLVLLPATGFLIGRLSRSLKKQSTESQEELGVLMSILDETLTGLRIIKAFNAEKILASKFSATNTTLNTLRNKMAFRRDLASPMSEFMGVLVLSTILWVGGRMVLGHSNGLEADGFITYIVFFTQIISPAKSLSTSFYNAQRGSSAIQRIEEILKAPELVANKTDALIIPSFNNEIEFRNVSFEYEGVRILKDINLKIGKGKTIALVGASGAGKSTLVDLIPRFHDVSAGELLIDGIDIREYSLFSVRKLMGIVTQEPILFNETIANNITLGTENTSIEAIENAATVANALNFIRCKDQGLDTNIGDRGNKLSGGEKQRITIARAVLKNPPILILDEATSSLDTESERLVQDAIYNMMKNRTSIVIAHRLSTIRNADEIIVLEKGEIAERGTHENLIMLNGIYKKLVDMQEVK
ncbi:MAG: ABC transporter ATP-binding protein [Sphingobacteriia bacterium]|nr:MAG: ABC transporter ATP-binding protein [Sphingobacteriia bacterium]